MQRQAMGVALHIVLLPFLNYCIAQLIHTMPTVLSAFFCPSILAFSAIPQATLPNAFGILLWWAIAPHPPGRRKRCCKMPLAFYSLAYYA
jgi:hypothetical protein